MLVHERGVQASVCTVNSAYGESLQCRGILFLLGHDGDLVPISRSRGPHDEDFETAKIESIEITYGVWPAFSDHWQLKKSVSLLVNPVLVIVWEHVIMAGG